MATANPVQPAPQLGLAPEWQDWLTTNIVRGVVDADLLRVMCENGFDEQFARVTILVVRSMTERVRQQNPSLLTEYKADPMRMPANAVVRAFDRDVRIGFCMTDPNLALVNDFLSEQECAKLIQFSSGKLKRSEVVDRQTGALEISGVRSSEGTHFGYAENQVVDRIERRLAALTGLPIDHGEPLQILHYPVGGEYLPHHDYFDPSDPGSGTHLSRGGQRVATMVIYLNDVAAGGDTVFPELDLAIKPRPGTAIYFEYTNREGLLDPRCLHGGSPVVRGEKWIATKWIRQGPYRS
jgi:prolyl 4-hydroxylase